MTHASERFLRDAPAVLQLWPRMRRQRVVNFIG